jgi:hypothetical protein
VFCDPVRVQGIPPHWNRWQPDRPFSMPLTPRPSGARGTIQFHRRNRGACRRCSRHRLGWPCLHRPVETGGSAAAARCIIEVRLPNRKSRIYSTSSRTTPALFSDDRCRIPPGWTSSDATLCLGPCRTPLVRTDSSALKSAELFPNWRTRPDSPLLRGVTFFTATISTANSNRLRNQRHMCEKCRFSDLCHWVVGIRRSPIGRVRAPSGDGDSAHRSLRRWT